MKKLTILLLLASGLANAETGDKLNVGIRSPSQNIKRLTVDDSRTVNITGPIGALGPFGDPNGDVANKIKTLGRESKKPIYLLINSPGGSVLDGAMILSAMEASPAPIVTICTQVCASMAFIIFEYGTERLMVNRAILMGHPAAGQVAGTLEQMNGQLQMILRYVGKMDKYIADKMGIPIDKFKSLTVSEMWIDGEDAVNVGLADGLADVLVSGSSGFPGFSPVEDRIKLVW